jgi:hypothetical protein
MTTLNLKISRNDLAASCYDLAEDVKTYMEQLGEAQLALYNAEQQEKLIEAQLYVDIQVNPAKYGNLKLTVDTIKALVIKQTEYQAAVAAISAAKATVKGLDAIVEGLQTKRSALKYLTEMTTSGYINSMDAPSGVRKRGES